MTAAADVPPPSRYDEPCPDAEDHVEHVAHYWNPEDGLSGSTTGVEETLTCPGYKVLPRFPHDAPDAAEQIVARWLYRERERIPLTSDEALGAMVRSLLGPGNDR